MPPKPKFTREEIVAAALDLVSEKGMAALTARDIGERLGVSARPVFTAFQNMDEVRQQVRRAARKRFERCIHRAFDYTPPFKQMGMQTVLFAQEEPKLFQLLFMESDGIAHTLNEGYLSRDGSAAAAMTTIQAEYGLSFEQARALFHHVWIFTFGIGALCATGVCSFTMEEVSELLGQDFMAILSRIQSGAFRQSTIYPMLKEEGGVDG